MDDPEPICTAECSRFRWCQPGLLEIVQEEDIISGWKVRVATAEGDHIAMIGLVLLPRHPSANLGTGLWGKNFWIDVPLVADKGSCDFGRPLLWEQNTGRAGKL